MIWGRKDVPVRAGLPIVAVGSLMAGGTGKTPMVIALAQRLLSQGRGVHVVTSGPGAPLRISERDHSADNVGDEPLLLAAFVPTWSAADPLAGIAAAQAAGAEVVVLDGGVPEEAVLADLRILVESAVQGLGNGRAKPLGPLKVPLKRGLAAADMLITVGPEAAQARFPSVDLPREPARLVPLETGMDWDGMRVFAFAGIGVPERFFASLHDLGAEVVGRQPLTDHQEMTDILLTRLAREAAMLGAQLVTTEKDAVRLPPDVRPHVLVLPVRLELMEWTRLDHRLAQLFGAA